MIVIEATSEVTVRIDVKREDAITRCIENIDGWRDMFYPLDTREKVLDHWAFNAIANGYEDASRLDGWADLERGDVTMEVDRDSIEVVHRYDATLPSGGH